MSPTEGIAVTMYSNYKANDISWLERAACKGKTELFFAFDGERSVARERRERAALSICHECDVVLKCREYARRNGESGIWGGETDEQRYANGYVLRDPVVARKARARKTRLLKKL